MVFSLARADGNEEHYFIDSILHQAFGMSECSGPHAMATDNGFRLGSVGRTMVGCKTKISEPDADGCGEILLAGRHVFIG